MVTSESIDKINFIVMGSEESCAINDFGYRPLIFANALSRSGRIGRVLVINSPVSIPRRVADRINRKKRIEDRYPVVLKMAFGSVVKVNEKLFMLSLSSLFPESSILSGIGSKMNTDSISAVIKKLGFGDFVLWVTSPRMVDIASRITAKTKIFDAIDDMLAHPQMTAFYEKIKKAYKWVEDNADLICIAAEGQRKMFPHSSKLFLMPNGVDNIFLNNTMPEIPPDMKDVQKPVIGYIGVLQDRFDVALTSEVARILHDHRFVFVGPARNHSYFKPLFERDNIRFLGKRNYVEIPHYIQSFDVCIIPHKVNEFTDSMNPLKIYEYLACGKPIVSTPIAGTEGFKDHIYLADEPKKFAETVKRAISEDNAALSTKRRHVASQCSLDIGISKLVAKISEMIR